MRLVVFVVVLFHMPDALARASSEDQPYCALRFRRLCQGKGRHVGCQYPDAGAGPYCHNYSPIKFQDNLKHFITNYINRCRQRIASGAERVRGGLHLPKPEVMMMVEWDRELAKLAQRLADQCTFEHDDCRATATDLCKKELDDSSRGSCSVASTWPLQVQLLRYPYAGQTVGEVRWRRSSDSDQLTAQRAIRRVFDAWWGERRRVQPQQLTMPFRLTARGAVWGHFSQLAVWSLRAVGCGAVRHGATYPRLLLVCDFSHTNMLGQRTLTPGPLTTCPVHTARKSRSPYPLLCAPVRHPTAATEKDDLEKDDIAYISDDEDEETTVTVRVRQTYSNVTAEAHSEQSTTTVKRKQTTTSEQEPTMALRSMTDYKFHVIPRKQTAKGTLLDKLDHELEIRRKMNSKNQVMNNVQVQDVRSRESSNFWRHNDRDSDADASDNDDEGDSLVMVQRSTKRTMSPHAPEMDYELRRPAHDNVSDSENEQQHLVARHKWQQTRDRPKRPGASALLNLPLSVQQHTQRRHGPLMQDKDDIDQLFQDTGYNPSWVKQIPVR